MDKKEARKILGVSKETSKHDIERKYSILLKKHKMAKVYAGSEAFEYDQVNQNIGSVEQNAAVTSGNVEKQQEYSFEQITQAYNVLMDYEVAVKEEPPSKAAPLLKKAGIDEKKARNFYYYYKFHILGAIIAIIAIVFTVRGCVTRVDPDFMTAFIGKISYYETEKLKDAIKLNIPEIKEPGFDGAFMSDDDAMGGEQQYAMNMKATVLFAAGEIDIFITDKVNFERYAKQGAFLSLDEIAGQLGIDMEKNKDYIVKPEDGSEEDTGEKPTGDSANNSSDEIGEAHLYGIDISNSIVLKEAGIYGEELIASIFIRCEQKDKAVKMLQFLLK